MLPEKKRIGDNYLRGDKVDGDTVTSAEFNELETVVKEAVNANYKDIQMGNMNNTLMFNALTTDMINLRTEMEVLDLNKQNNLISGSTIKTINGTSILGEGDIVIEGGSGSSVPVFYWNGASGEPALELFNNICRMYDNGEPFVLVGKVSVEDGWYYAGQYSSRDIDVVAPITVKKYINYEANVDDEGNPIKSTVFSFCTEIVPLPDGFVYGSIELTGEWGAFTSIKPIGWNYVEGPSKHLEKMSGFDRTKNQVLKNINGVFTWVDEV